jgi:hypothetical protein
MPLGFSSIPRLQRLALCAALTVIEANRRSCDRACRTYWRSLAVTKHRYRLWESGKIDPWSRGCASVKVNVCVGAAFG